MNNLKTGGTIKKKVASWDSRIYKLYREAEKGNRFLLENNAEYMNCLCPLEDLVLRASDFGIRF